MQKHVLVVDDDPNVVDMLGQILPEAEFKLEAASDGMVALEAIERARPDIILLDIIMPRLDGFGFIDALRSNPHTCELPVIVISARELAAIESLRLRERVSAVIRKQGLAGDKLIDEIHRALQEPRKPEAIAS